MKQSLWLLLLLGTTTGGLLEVEARRYRRDLTEDPNSVMLNHTSELCVPVISKDELMEEAILGATKVVIKQMEKYSLGQAISTDVVTSVSHLVMKELLAGNSIQEMVNRLHVWCVLNRPPPPMTSSTDAVTEAGTEAVTEAGTEAGTEPQSEGSPPSNNNASEDPNSDYDYDVSSCRSESCEVVKPPTFRRNKISWLCLSERGKMKCYTYHYDVTKEISVEEDTPRPRTVARPRSPGGARGYRSRARLNRRSAQKSRKQKHKLAARSRKHGVRRTKSKRTKVAGKSQVLHSIK